MTQNLDERLWDWWNSLDEHQRATATSIDDRIPDWMATTLHQAKVLVIDADLNGDGHVRLLPTIVREFLDRRSSCPG
jgi:hypothetical protein